MPLFKIEVVSCFRNTYVVEADDAEAAEDAFLVADMDHNDPPVEVDQKHVGTLNFMTDEISRRDLDRILEASYNGHLGDALVIQAGYATAKMASRARAATEQKNEDD